MTKKNESGPASIAQNKKARFDYFIEDRIEAGLALQGWEVKSMRAGKAQITDSFVILREGEAWLLGSHVTPLNTVSTHITAEPKRIRKLLLNRREIDRLTGLVERKGYTLIALELYWSKNRVKVSVGLAKGKKQHDKRDTEKDRDWQRDKSRALKARHRESTQALVSPGCGPKLESDFGGDWLRHESRNLRCMPRCRILVKPSANC